MAIGFDQDEDEKFKQMLGGILGNGPAPYDVTTSMEQPEQSQLSAPYMPQSAPAMGMGGYTPPPAAAAPQYLDHVQGHQFGAGDIAMLGGILAALLGGGKHRGEIAGSLAGQYGGAIMQNNARADQHNQQVDQFNSQLAAKDDPLERWKADMMGKQAVGNLEARNKELMLQQSREERIAAAQAAEDAKDPLAQHQGLADIDVETNKRKLGNELDMRTKLAKILGKGQYAAPGGKGADDPVKLLKKKQAQAILDGIDAGTIDPTTGNPKPKTPAQIEREDRLNTALAPFEGTEVGDMSVWKPIASDKTTREKSRRDDAALAGALPALDAMIKLREDNGAESGFGKKSGEVTGAYDVELGKVESALGVLKNIGVISPTEAARLEQTIPTLSPGLSDVSRIVPESLGGGDSTLGKLNGARKEWEDLVSRGRAKYGLRAKSASTEQPIGESADGGIKYSVDTDAEKRFNAGEGDKSSSDSGTRAVTIVAKDGRRKTATLTEDKIRELQNDPRVESVQ